MRNAIPRGERPRAARAGIQPERDVMIVYDSAELSAVELVFQRRAVRSPVARREDHHDPFSLRAGGFLRLFERALEPGRRLPEHGCVHCHSLQRRNTENGEKCPDSMPFQLGGESAVSTNKNNCYENSNPPVS